MKEYCYKGYKATNYSFIDGNKKVHFYEVNLHGYSYYFETLQAFKDWANHRIELFAE